MTQKIPKIETNIENVDIESQLPDPAVIRLQLHLVMPAIQSIEN